MRGGVKVLFYFAGAVVLGVATVHWLKTLHPDAPPAPDPVPAAAGQNEGPPPRRFRPAPAAPAGQPGRITPSPPPRQAAPTQYAASAWEEQIDRVLVSQAPPDNQVRLLRAMFKSLPPEGQQEAAEHMANLAADEEYGLGELLTDPGISEAALQALLIDLSNRPESVRLPLLLEVARVPNHPLRETALEELAFLVGEDHGNDWAKWEAAIGRALQP